MPQDYPEPSVDSIPSIEEFGPIYEEMLTLAHELLDGPVQTQIRTWEDEEFEVRVYHGYGPYIYRPSLTYRHILRYHSDEGDVEEALVSIEAETMDRTLIYRESIDPTGVATDATRPQQKNWELVGGD